MTKNQSGENVPNAETQPEEFVTVCGGIKPIVIPEITENEVEECTEQS